MVKKLRDGQSRSLPTSVGKHWRVGGGKVGTARVCARISVCALIFLPLSLRTALQKWRRRIAKRTTTRMEKGRKKMVRDEGAEHMYTVHLPLNMHVCARVKLYGRTLFAR